MNLRPVQDIRNSTTTIIGLDNNNDLEMMKGYTYDIYGKATAIGNEDFINDITFTGAIAEGGDVYYMNARFYDANTQRFLSQDTYKGNAWEPMSQNLYTYVGNNPVNYIDPTGHWPQWLNGGTVAAIAGAVAVTVAVGAIIAVTGGVAIPLVAAVGASLGTTSTIVATSATVVGIATFGLAGAATATMGVATMVEGVTGENVIKEKVFNGDEQLYNNVMTAGTMISVAGSVMLAPLAIDGYSSLGNNSTTVIDGEACFVEGTQIITKDGFKNIEDIEVGDEVLSENTESGGKEYKRVTNTFINESKTIITVEVNGELIETTPEHPFWVESKGWVKAANLKYGDAVRLSNGGTALIKSVIIIELDEPVKVYNFEVEEHHTYYVTNIGVLVHNTCKIQLTNKQVRNMAEEQGMTEVKNQYSNGQLIFKKGNMYYTYDVDGHTGGFWKGAKKNS